MFQRLFLFHPRAMGESYAQHQRAALSYAAPLFAAALACLIHAVVPGLFERTGSRIIGDLHGRMARRGIAGTN